MSETQQISTEKQVTYLKPHISLNVADVERSVEFYKKMLGLEPMKFIKAQSAVHSIVQDAAGVDSSKERFGYAKFDVQEPPLNLVLNEVPFTQGGSLSHLGLQVAATEDVLAVRERWIAENLITVDEMQVDCCYAKQDKTWVRDPDGNEWEVFTVLENLAPEATTSCDCGNKVSEYVEGAAAKAVSCCAPTPTQISSSPASSAAMPKHETCCEAN